MAVTFAILRAYVFMVHFGAAFTAKGSRKNNLAFCCGSHAQLNHNRQAAMVCWAWEPQPCGARRPRRVSAALPLLDDITTSPASRRLASACPALAPKCQLILARTLSGATRIHRSLRAR